AVTPSALRRFYGFGERLRFPHALDLAKETDFMIVQPTVEDVPGWLVTNAHSLLGQVFRLGAVPSTLAAADFHLDAVSICGHDLPASGLPANDLRHPRLAIETQLDAAFLEAKQNATSKVTFGASLTQDPQGDRVWFLPRRGRPQTIGLVHPNTGK